MTKTGKIFFYIQPFRMKRGSSLSGLPDLKHAKTDMEMVSKIRIIYINSNISYMCTAMKSKHSHHYAKYSEIVG